MKLFFYPFFAYLVFIFLFTSCVNTDKQKDKNEIVNIRIEAFGEHLKTMGFSPDSIEIPANSVVKLKLVNVSKSNSMFHNLVICTNGSWQKVGFKGIEAGKSKHYTPNIKEVITGTPIVNPGDSVSITFNAPEKGLYDFICSFPGHYTLMRGKVLVN